MPAKSSGAGSPPVGSVLHAVREQGIERTAPVGNDLRVCALGGVAERSGPAYQLVVFARVQVSGVVGDLIDPAQPTGHLAGYRIAARDEAQCFGRIPLRVCRAPARLCVHGVIPEPVGQPSPAWSGKDARAAAASSSSAAFRTGMIAGKARRRLISASREARSRVNNASSHGSASR